MALVLTLKSVENLPGKADRLIQATYRGLTYTTKIIPRAKGVAYFGQTFEWPVAREAESDESLHIQLFNFSKYLNNKCIGTYSLFLQHLIEHGELKISESLTDHLNRISDINITFEVRYYSPDGKVGQWNQGEFTGDDVDGQSIGSGSSYRPPSGLEDTMSFKFEEMEFGEAGSYNEDAGSAHAMNETVYSKRRRPDLLDQELHMPKDFQICVTILEASQLAGLNIDPVIRVNVGEDHRYTSIKQSTNTPYFNEYFVFDFSESPAMVFDKIINITAYHAYGIPGREVFKAGNIVAGKRTIGSFRCDVGTVYATADHQYYHKWAPLIDPKDMSAGPKGFVKCDISVSGKGDILKAPKGGKEDDSDNIEGNLLLPAGVALDRQRAVYQVIIYRGEDLPRTDFGIFTSMRNAISLNKVAFVDAYVKVSFVGHIGKTSSKKSYNPDWKEILTFTDMFPPLCNRIKIQICDSDPIKDDPIGTHFIELSQIMDPGGDTDGILPSFGPSFINFYGSPRRYNIQGGSDELNEGLGEGSAYRGRLLMQLTTTILDAESGGVSSVSREKLLRTGGQSDFKPRKELILFATLFEAAMINGEFANKSVYFEISIGKYGNTIDSKGRAKLFEKTDDEESDEEEESSRILKERKEEEDELFKFSSTPAQNAISIDNTYCYMPWKEEKPCLFVGALFEDERKRLYHSNMIQGMSDKMEEGLEDTGQMIKNDHELSHRRLRGVIEEFEHGLDDYMRHAPLLGVGAGAGKTNLDRHRLNFCKNSLDKFKQQVKKIRKSVKPANVRDKYYEMKRIAGKVRRMARDPQHGLPDVFLWMIVEKKRVAYYRFPARSLLNATTDDQRGRHCGEMQTIFLRKPGMKGLGSTGWAMQAKLQVLLWLGERDKNGSNPKYLQNLPPGYECKYTMYQDQSPPPTSIVYPQSHKFELRAFVFCARSLIGSDNSGLSDPFARIIVGNQCKTTQVAFETLSPRWEETFVFKDLVFNGPLEEIQKSPPIVIVEFYDHDMVGDPEYLGRCIIHPKVKVENEPYCAPEWPAQPEWWDVYRGTSLSGEMLACFELLHGDTSDAPVLPDPIPIDPRNPQLTLLRIPPMIMPPISTYRIEVLFWGVRDFKRQLLSSVSRPRIDVEVAGKILRSRRIESLGRHSNFEEPLQYFDLDMPDNEMWWPPLTIRCVDCKNFGRENLVGTCTVNFLANYVFVPLEERQRVAEESRQQLLKERYETNKHHEPQAVVPNAASTDVLIDIEPEVKPSSRPGTVMADNMSITSGRKSAADNMSIKSGQPSHLVASDNKTLLSVKTNGGAADTRSIRSGHVSIAMGDVPNVDIKSTRGSVMHLSPVPEGQEDSKSVKSGQDAATSVPGTAPPIQPPMKIASKLKPSKNPEEEERLRRDKREMIAELDWWSKYYVVKDDCARSYKKNLDKTEKSHVEDCFVLPGYDLDILDYSVLDANKMNELQKMAAEKKRRQEEEADALSGKKKKKKKKKKIKIKNPKESASKFKGLVNHAFNKDDEEGDDMSDSAETERDDKSHIARFQFYEHELENIPEFGGFEELLHTFDLLKGKKTNDEEEDCARLSGKFKGTFAIYKLNKQDDLDEVDAPEKTANNNNSAAVAKTGKAGKGKTKGSLEAIKAKPKINLKLAPEIPFHKSYDLHVRVYVIRAFDLHPADLNGKSDPYLIVKCGRHVTNDKANRIMNMLNPCFGKLFEFNVTFPVDSMLRVQVMDYDKLSADDIIGETVIDLENRILSKHRPRCGIQQQYDTFGYNQWRDCIQPTAIVERLCKDVKMQNPDYRRDSVYIAGRIYYAEGEIENDAGEMIPTRELLAMEILKHWDEIPGGCKLVPEHVETRVLYNPDKPGIEQGRLEMWVDIFPKDLPMPSVTIDITPRLPISYELRIIIWNTDDVILEDKNVLTGEMSSDIFVRGYLKGPALDGQQTDIHYRSLTGEGNFNWRFVFPFDYLKAEEKAVYTIKEGVFDASETEQKIPPQITLQVWDADIVSSDDFLGSVVLDMNRIPKPAKNLKNCSLKMLKKDGSVPTLNLFKNKRCKGWWPMSVKEPDGELKLVGKVEAEFHLCEAEEAERSPVGCAREDPEGLQEPNRPDSSFFWLTNPLKTMKYVLWKNYKWLIFKLVLLLLLLVFIILFFYTVPSATVNKIWDIMGS